MESACTAIPKLKRHSPKTTAVVSIFGNLAGSVALSLENTSPQGNINRFVSNDGVSYLEKLL